MFGNSDFPWMIAPGEQQCMVPDEWTGASTLPPTWCRLLEQIQDWSGQGSEFLEYFLGGRFEFCRTWLAVSRAIPTFRKNGGQFLFRREMRFLTHVDKLACLGWPVTGPTAGSMGTTPLPALDPMRSDIMAGNSMHLTCAATVLLLGMVCFGLKDYFCKEK